MKRINITTLISCLLFCLYSYLLCSNLSPYWFNPIWITDDSLQQAFPFHAVYHPDIFVNDLVTEKMLGHLPTFHYWISWIITWMTHDPIMTGHWVMLIQLTVSLFFVFFAVKYSAGLAPAFFAVTWLLHTRPFIQRIAGGLPRGWVGPIIASFIYFALTGNHLGILISIFLGCMLHPPATLIIATAYGLFLIFKTISRSTRPEYSKHLFRYLALCPLYAILVLFVVSQSDGLGQIVDLKTALTMPELLSPNGRFPFLPFPSILNDLNVYGFQAFINKIYDPGFFLQNFIPIIVSSVFILLLLLSKLKNKSIIPNELSILLLAIFLVYFASRFLAFKLYIPNRHLQLPLIITSIVIFSIAIWRLPLIFKSNNELGKSASSFSQGLALILLGAFIFIGTGHGLYGNGNFNYWATKKGDAFNWLKNNTLEHALIAGHPTHINAVPLFAMRKAYATTETTHPFYPKYHREIKRRLEVSLKAHYSKDLNEFLNILEPEKIDYFVFSRKRFYPKALKSERYFAPLDVLVKELTLRDPNDYAYKMIPSELNPELTPYLVFRDDESVIIDLNKLKLALR